MKLYTTLKLLKEHRACESSFNKLKEALEAGWDLNKPIDLLIILEKLNLDDCLWAFRTVEDQPAAKWAAVAFAVWCAEQVLFLFETLYQDDTRPSDALRIVKNWEQYSDKEVLKTAYAARDAARAAADAANAADTADAVRAAFAADAVADAAYAAADAAYAVRAAADVATYAANAAANAAADKKIEINKQIEKLKELLN